MQDKYIFSLFLYLFLQLCHAGEPSLFDPVAMEESNIVFLEQNWSEKDRQYFYHADQGSRLVPLDIYLALEQADSEKLFNQPGNILRFGFIPDSTSKTNPLGLPLGFAQNQDYMGPTCAACHTQQIRYGDRIIRIDGGQAMADLPLFLTAMTRAMAATLDNEDKFARFQQRILGSNASPARQQALRARLQSQKDLREDYGRRHHSNVPYGFSRLDAFGAILNKGLYLGGEKDNFNSPNAPTSYPYIWDTPQHDYVEWNGSQTNSSLGALARNVGEVIGVFGEIETEPTSWLGFYDAGYSSSIRAAELRELEKTVARLHSPLWPGFFPALDKSKAEQGRELYESHCIQCHVDIDRTDPARKIKVRMSSLGEVKTDPLMAKNAVEHRGRSGIFKGRLRFYAAGEKLAAEAPALYIVNNVMGGVLKNNPLQVILAKRDAGALGHPDELHPPKYMDGKFVERGREVANETLLAYKARPLNGIWATAPFLHNGSVPNLYELLLPAAERSKSFYIGSLEYDTRKVGYVSEYTAQAFEFDTSLPGNSNAGHEYLKGEYGNEPFTEEEIWALVEYMKGL